MQREINGKTIDIEPNCRPHILKRIAADGFDITTVFIVFMALTYLLVNTPLANTYNEHYARYKAIEQQITEQYHGDSQAISAALSADEEYLDEVLAANLHGYVLKAYAALAAEALFLLIIPLANRRRSTLGRMMTGTMLFDERRQAKAAWHQALSRFLFAYLFDSLALYLLTGLLTFLLVVVLRLIQMLLNRKYKTIVDYMTGTMIIEQASYNGIN
ncbi:MAG: RDD family protein [Erysipelotrichaceae bacterium]|nr:RDD family protein [Erysipelotrichaceae bacterium]